MRGTGIMLILLGAASVVLPRMGIPLGIRFIPAEYQLHAAIACAAAGVVLLFLGRGKKKDAKK